MQSGEQGSERVRRWLKQAKWAASGGNAQPWRVEYELEDDRICLTLSVGEDYRQERWSPMDVDGMASVMALGALAFNLEVVAAHDKFELVQTDLVEGDSLFDGQVVLIFVPSRSAESVYSEDDLYLRRTNRELYKTDPLPETYIQSLRNIVTRRNPQLMLASVTEKKDQLLKSILGLERVRWSDPKFLDSLLDEIDFSKNSQFGIPVDQLGVKPADQNMMQAIYNKRPLRSIFKYGGQYMASHQNLTTPIKKSAGAFFIQAPDFSLSSCFDLGYVFQHMWTELNKLQLAFQPVSVSLVALSLIRKSERSPSEEKALSAAKSYFKDVHNMNLANPIMGFRTGYPNKEVGKSARREIRGYPKHGQRTPMVNPESQPVDLTKKSV